MIELRGYSDGAESAEQGSALSAVRAQTVAWYFVQHGVSSNRVRVMAFQEIGRRFAPRRIRSAAAWTCACSCRREATLNRKL